LILLGAEVWAIEKFLQAEHLHLLLCSLFDQLEMFVDHRLLDLSQAVIWTKGIVSLN